MTGTMTQAAVAPTPAIRARFPALSRLHEGHPVAHFDGPGGTQVPDDVVDAMRDYLLHHNANTHWAYPTSEETDVVIAGARQALADFLNARAEDIAFGANMTTLTFHLARALGRRWGPDDEIVITELDHHANIAPWRALERERGVRIRVARLDPETRRLDFDDLAAAVGARTRLVAVGAASNAIGTITDVARVAEVARAAGALTFVDAVHYAPHVLVDAQAMGCDFLACSAYKFYGPHIGVLYGRSELVRELDVPKLAPAPDSAPERLETGTQNHEGMAGAAAAVDFLASFAGREGSRRERLARSFGELHARGSGLVRRLREGLDAIGGVRRFGPPEGPYTPTVAFTVRGVPAERVVRSLVRRGIFATHGDFYATTVVERLGQAEHGLVRAGCACYTSDEEVERLLAAVDEVANGAG
jgi:cysteine desulfurase family protein (TIGR01976 family)